MNIISKNITMPKLTMAIDRTELKIPVNTNDILKGRLIALSDYILSKIEKVNFTLRGSFSLKNEMYAIKLYEGTHKKKRLIHEFSEEEIKNV